MTAWKRIDYRKTAGTGLVGYVDASIDDLIATFGEPDEGGDKTRAQWRLLFDGIVVTTIYDYKSDTPLAQERRWHVGGNSMAFSLMALRQTLPDTCVIEPAR